MKQIINCCGCGKLVIPRLTDGKEIYPHRDDLHNLPFWKCDVCGNFVGCHHKTKQRTKPLGSIPTPKIRELRKEIHALLDPIWKFGVMSRQSIYAMLTDVIGRQYHTAEINTQNEAALVLEALAKIGEK